MAYHVAGGVASFKMATNLDFSESQHFLKKKTCEGYLMRPTFFPKIITWKLSISLENVMTSYFVTIATNSRTNFTKKCLRNERTATEKGKCWYKIPLKNSVKKLEKNRFGSECVFGEARYFKEGNIILDRNIFLKGRVSLERNACLLGEHIFLKESSIWEDFRKGMCFGEVRVFRVECFLRWEGTLFGGERILEERIFGSERVLREECSFEEEHISEGKGLFGVEETHCSPKNTFRKLIGPAVPKYAAAYIERELVV